MMTAQTALSVIGDIAFPSGRKDYKLYIHLGRVQPESASSPKIIDK